MNKERFFIGCDWGTSSIRLAWIDRETLIVYTHIQASLGIKKVYEEWSGKKNKIALSREAFYLQKLTPLLQKLAEKAGANIQNMPLVISGMASSSIGIRELAYAHLPFSLKSYQGITHILSNATLSHPVYMISGVEKPGDVMRGEETQVLGLQSIIEDSTYRIILPGTHSKHIRVESRQIADFSTFMTGELFDLILHKSILANSLIEASLLETEEKEISFQEGIQASHSHNILQQIFSIRARDLQNRMGKKEGFLFLSGLLIGQELRNMDKGEDSPIYVVGSSRLKSLYEMGLKTLGFEEQLTQIPQTPTDHLSFLGQAQILTDSLSN